MKSTLWMVCWTLSEVDFWDWEILSNSYWGHEGWRIPLSLKLCWMPSQKRSVVNILNQVLVQVSGVSVDTKWSVFLVGSDDIVFLLYGLRTGAEDSFFLHSIWNLLRWSRMLRRIDHSGSWTSWVSWVSLSLTSPSNVLWTERQYICLSFIRESADFSPE